MTSCIVATHSAACRERMERLMMQGPVGADRVVRTTTRHDEAFARHLEEHNETEKKIARRSTDAQETTSDQPLSSLSSSGTNRADNNVQQRQESNDGVHEQDADMKNDDKEKQCPRKKGVTSLSAGTEKQKMM